MRLFVILFYFYYCKSEHKSTNRYNKLRGNKEYARFYEYLKQQLTYPEAWGNSGTKDFEAWRSQARNIVMECMQNMPPAPKEYNMSVAETEQRAGYEARKIWFNISEWSRIPAYLLVPEGKGPFPAIVMLHDHGAHFPLVKRKWSVPLEYHLKYRLMPRIG